MVFVRKSPGRSGSTKVQIAESRAGRDVVLEHVGTARTDVELVVLMAHARRRIEDGQDALDLGPVGLVGREDEGVPGRPGVIPSKSSALLWQVLATAYARLGFDVVEDEAFKRLVLAWIIEPTSKADTVRVLGEIGFPRCRCARCSGRCNAPRNLTTATRSRQPASLTPRPAGNVSLVLYDVTTLYFEAENEDELRKVGYSEERRVDPQVVVGLLVDRGGFPLEIGCFEAYKAETSTVVSIVKQFRSVTASRTWSWLLMPGRSPRRTCVTWIRRVCGSSSCPGSRRPRRIWSPTSAGTAPRSPTDRSSRPSHRGISAARR